MKKSYIYKGIAALAVAFSMTACDFLDKEPSNELTGQQVFSDWVTMEQFHFDTYNFLLNGECRINGSWLDAATDLAETSVSNSGTRTSFNIGNYYAAGGAAELTTPWESRFRAIRKCNMLLERIETVPQPTDIDQATYEKRKGYYKGEAMALRAWFYWELFLRYGTVPIIKEVLNPDGDLLSNYNTRPSLVEFKNFLISDLDAAYPLVMDKGTSYESGNEGRVNQPVVMALKSRILLYMASPRFSAESGVTWQQAADAAKEFIDNYGTSYKLATPTKTPFSGTPTTRPTPRSSSTATTWHRDGEAMATTSTCPWVRAATEAHAPARTSSTCTTWPTVSRRSPTTMPPVLPSIPRRPLARTSVPAATTTTRGPTADVTRAWQPPCSPTARHGTAAR